jgi:hypothetical protein
MGLLDLFTKKQVATGGAVGFSGPAVQLPAKPADKHQTAADVLDYYCAKHKATYERTRKGERVRVRVHMPSGDVLAGTGATTLEAVTAVVQKMEAAQ